MHVTHKKVLENQLYYFVIFCYATESQTSTRVKVSPRKAPSEDGFSYTVKIITQHRKNDYPMEALPSCTHHFTSVSNLKRALSEAFGFQVGGMGFVTPGHALKVDSIGWHELKTYKMCILPTRNVM